MFYKKRIIALEESLIKVFTLQCEKNSNQYQLILDTKKDLEFFKKDVSDYLYNYFSIKE